jgi:hypothetical protein
VCLQNVRTYRPFSTANPRSSAANDGKELSKWEMIREQRLPCRRIADNRIRLPDILSSSNSFISDRPQLRAHSPSMMAFTVLGFRDDHKNTEDTGGTKIFGRSSALSVSIEFRSSKSVATRVQDGRSSSRKHLIPRKDEGSCPESHRSTSSYFLRVCLAQ